MQLNQYTVCHPEDNSFVQPVSAMCSRMDVSRQGFDMRKHGHQTCWCDTTDGMSMLSPDNYVQQPGNPQNYNRYAYCKNNPLKYTDPSGESLILAGLALGTFMTGSILDHLLNPGDYNDENAWGAIKAGAGQGLNAYNQINDVTSFPIYSDENWDISLGLSLIGGPSFYSGISYKAGDLTFGGNLGLNYGVNLESNVAEWVPFAGGGISYYNSVSKLGATIGAT
ncbi:MAG: hypothetical protein ACQES0_07870, partial [Bacteroidota bacterium]